MIFTLNYYTNFLYFFIILYILTVTTGYYHLTGYWSVDLHVRSDLNLIGISNLFWIWTNTYYLYSILIIVLISFILGIYKSSFSYLKLILLTYCVLIFLELFTNHSLVNNVGYKTFDLELYNLLLNNSINKIHPLMIYISWFSILILFAVRLKMLHIKYSTINIFLLYKLTIFISLILGGWWAYQEGSWGGWWNWDPSEMFGLLIFFSLALLTHNSLSKSHTINYYIKILVSYTFVYYIFLQLNFSLLSHNFGIRQGDIIDFRVSYLTFALFIMYFALRKSLKLPRLDEFIKSYYYYSVVFILYLILYISSAELWSDLIWRLYGIDLYNSSSILSMFLLTITLLLFIRYFSISVISATSIFLLMQTNNVLIPIIIYFVNMSWSKYTDLHKLALSLIFLIFIYSSFSTTLWTHRFSLDAPNSIVVNLPLLHGDSPSVLSDYLNYYSYLNSNTVETKPFALINSNNITEQCYSISLDDIIINSSTIDFVNLLVVFTSIIFINLFVKSINNILIIKF